MIVSSHGDSLRIEAPAKVNLFLEVLGKRADGFHELETLLVTISLHDTLVFREISSGTEFRCSDPTLPTGDNNLVMRAVQLFRKESGTARGVEIELEKRIPAEAGLAGGSSDAAATLAGLNHLWGLNWPVEKLAELGAQLGSDVPFFFFAPAAVARGRGERIHPCKMQKPLDLVIVCPRLGLSTARVFGNLKIPVHPIGIEPMTAALERGDVPEVARLLHNRLEEASLGMNQELARVKDDARTWSCLGHLMSGSGSAYFALCASARQAQELGTFLEARNLGSVFVVNSSQ